MPYLCLVINAKHLAITLHTRLHYPLSHNSVLCSYGPSNCGFRLKLPGTQLAHWLAWLARLAWLAKALVNLRHI